MSSSYVPQAASIPASDTVDAAGVMRWQVDAAGTPVAGSAELLAFLGLPADTDDIDWITHVHPDDQPAVRRAIADARDRGDRLTIVTRMRRHDGVFRQVMHRAGPLGAGMAGLAFDVSELEFGYVTHVCRGCKRVTDLDGRWRLSWDYLLGQARLDFTTCIDCAG